MRSLRLSLLLLGACLCAAAPASARTKPITGKLSKPGYSVIALGYNGTAVVSRSRSFRLVPRDSKVTLQLRDSRGRYAGPVVVGGKGSKAIVGVKAGAKLGAIKVLAGYARTAKPLRAGSVDKRRTAQARKGVPLGTGRNFGLVRSAKRAAAGAGGDQDLDGVPDALDIDANGNLVLNNEEGGAGGKARAAQTKPGDFSVFSQIGVSIDRSVNANAAGVTDADIDRLVQGTTSPPFQPIGMFLLFHMGAGDQVELDCGGLTYCSPGGTGRVRGPVTPDPGPSFPSCCDPDADGFGTLTGQPGPGGPETTLYPLASASQINSGDVFIARSTTGGVETDTPTTLNFVFNTTPALISWTSSGGQSGTVSYPVAPGAPGTGENPFPVTPGPDGTVQVTTTVWRPQRRAITGAGEGTGFIDLGHLLWESRLVNGQTVVDCNTGYSTTDPNLTANGDPNLGGLVDKSADAPASPANTLTYTLNLTACLNAKGAVWNANDPIQMEIVARSPAGGDNSSQQVFFKRAG